MTETKPAEKRRSRVLTRLLQSKYLYLLLLPALLDILIFHYVPIYGAQIAFKRFNVAKGIMGSEWVGFHYFLSFFRSAYFWPLLRNTLLINIYSLVYGFPVPIILAILLNEVRIPWYKKTVQTISYLPHFLSTVIVVGLLRNFLLPNTGIISQIVSKMGFEPINYLAKPRYFRTLYVMTGIWQGAGFSAIIYIAAIAGIDPELYDVASIDGAGRLRKIWHITLPGIAPTITILLILRIGGLLGVDWQKILLMENSLTSSVADTIQIFTYQRGLLNADFSFGSAVGLFTSVIGFVMVLGANQLAKRISGTYIF
ncbi:MAG: ABC transporter permease [Christensenellales bacterium]|jgi:putative aldouronate transport system permease protein